MKLFLSVFFGVINCASPSCFLVQNDDDFYGLFTGTTFLGCCDLGTLQKWQPLSFGFDMIKRRSSFPIKINEKLCDVRILSKQPRCICGLLEESISDFPTCFFGGRRLDTTSTSVSRRKSGYASVINNCILGRTKHADVDPLNSRRVKRSDFSQTIKRQRLWDCHHSSVGSCSFIRKYRNHLPADAKNQQLDSQKLSNSENEFERNSDAALVRILRAVAGKTAFRNGRSGRRVDKDKDDDEDDDDEDDDNLGEEDIAIEEDQNADVEVTTTETPEKVELKQQLHQEPKENNFEQNVNEKSTHKQNRSTQNSLNFTLSVLITLSLFWLL